MKFLGWRYLGLLGLLLGGVACQENLPSPTRPVDSPASVVTTRPATTSVPTTPGTTVSTTPPDTRATTTTTASGEVALVVGDFGTGTAAEQRVAAAMEQAAREEEAGWLVTTGDNFYGDNVEAVWSDPFGWVEEMGIEVVAALGNHDVESPALRRLATEELGIENDWYRAQIGDAVVVVLSGNRVEDDDQLEFLEDVLREAGDDLAVVVFHQPAFSCSKHGSTPAVMEQWVPLFEAHDVDLVLNGHDHNYQRHEREGVVYVVTGGGGARLYEMSSCPRGTSAPIVSDDTHHHFLTMTIGSESIAVEARAATGEILDTFIVR